MNLKYLCAFNCLQNAVINFAQEPFHRRVTVVENFGSKSALIEIHLSSSSFDEAILKIIHVSLSSNKTTFPEMGRVKLVFAGINLRHYLNSNEL